MTEPMENRVSGDSPFKQEFDRYIASHPGRGTLKVQVSAADQSFPVPGVFVDVAVIDDGRRYSLYHDVTDESGVVGNIVLPSCTGADNNAPETAGKNDATYLISVYHPAFAEITDFPVTVQDKIETILPVILEPQVQKKEG